MKNLDNKNNFCPLNTAIGQLICQYQNGDRNAALELANIFDPLLEHETMIFLKQELFREKEDAKSQAVLLFMEFIANFHDFEAANGKIAGLAKKYLHDSRIDLVKSAARHCPDCYTVDFEKELEENSPFSQYFPRCEIQADRELDRKFLKKVLLESMQFLTRKEGTVVKKIILENKPPSSVAQELHCSTRYIRRLKHSALAKMRLYLETHYPALKAI
ncbi:MAG: sigma-70 family RNA polymerase sigma factor [Acidaminococcaceae bacterium]|nr:sigma-70 family RNA polymerase sigma factor [Acidaminococcaceae bacterium]